MPDTTTAAAAAAAASAPSPERASSAASVASGSAAGTAAAGAPVGAPAGAPAAAGTPAADAKPAAPASAPAGGTTLTDPPKPVDAKPADEKPASPAPEKYDLKLPETAALDQSALDRTAAFARARGLSNDAAQAALELANTEAQAAVTAANERFIAAYSPGDPSKNIPPGTEWTRMQDDWKAAALAHPEIGNGKPEQFQAAVAQAGRAFERFASTEFRELLRTTGYGSHPELVRVFAKIGAAMGEGRFVTVGAETPGRLSDTDVFYKK